MAATLHHLHPPSPPLAAFLRVGHAGQFKLAGRFPYRRVVFDAAHLPKQLSLLKLLKASGCEVVLDPNFAEMEPAVRSARLGARLKIADDGGGGAVAAVLGR